MDLFCTVSFVVSLTWLSCIPYESLRTKNKIFNSNSSGARWDGWNMARWDCGRIVPSYPAVKTLQQAILYGLHWRL